MLHKATHHSGVDPDGYPLPKLRGDQGEVGKRAIDRRTWNTGRAGTKYQWLSKLRRKQCTCAVRAFALVGNTSKRTASGSQRARLNPLIGNTHTEY